MIGVLPPVPSSTNTTRELYGFPYVSDNCGCHVPDAHGWTSKRKLSRRSGAGAGVGNSRLTRREPEATGGTGTKTLLPSSAFRLPRTNILPAPPLARFSGRCPLHAYWTCPGQRRPHTLGPHTLGQEAAIGHLLVAVPLFGTAVANVVTAYSNPFYTLSPVNSGSRPLLIALSTASVRLVAPSLSRTCSM